MGRVALALAEVQDERSQYVGIDVSKLAIRWCRREIASRRANFRFVHADVFHPVYNPRAKKSPELYLFPLPDQEVDFVIAASLFTHFLPEGLEHYIEEIGRVLKPGGRLFSTWFLLDAISDAAIAAGKSLFRPPHRLPTHAEANLFARERTVAFPRHYVLSVLEKNGLAADRVERGSWFGEQAAELTHDLIVASRAD